jgi:hypothetical protein
MRILPEDIYELCPFRVYTGKKKITLETLNARRLNKFSVRRRKGNDTSQLNDIKSPGIVLSPKLTTNERLSLFHQLTYILSDLVEDRGTDNHWKLLIQLQEVTAIVFATKLTEGLLNYFLKCTRSILSYSKSSTLICQ